MYSSHKLKFAATCILVLILLTSIATSEEILDIKEDVSSGYIIQFNEKGTLAKYNELSENNQRNINKYNSMFFLNPVKWYYGLFVIKTEAGIQKEVSGYENALNKKIDAYLFKIEDDIGKDASNLRSRFSKSMVGVVLDIDENDAKVLKGKPYVRSVTPNLLFQASLSDSVSLMEIDQLWQMKDPGNNYLDGSGIIIAVIDTGFDLSNPVFSGIDVMKKQCFCSQEEPCCPDGTEQMSGDSALTDSSGHGTHILGILASQDDTYKGVAPSASYILVKASSGGSNIFSMEDIIKSFQYVIDPNNDGNFNDHADVLSLSFTAMPKAIYENVKEQYQGQFTDEELKAATIELFRPLNDILVYADTLGMTVVAAAGNEPESGNITAFAMIEEPLIIGATTKEDTIAPYTSEGPAFNGLSAPDAVAVGGCTFDCVNYGEYGNLDNNGRFNYLRENAQKGVISAKSSTASCIVKVLDVCFDTGAVFGKNQELYTFEEGKFVSVQGTSASAPFVAGIAALIRQKNPDWTTSQIQTAIKNSAIDIGMPENKQGMGRVDAVAAINYDFTCTGKDLMTDEDNCGVCGHRCSGQYGCTDGVCESCGDNVCNGLETHSSCPGDCPACTPQCEDYMCGDDGCGGTCGTCEEGQVCQQRKCAVVISGFTVTCTGGVCDEYVLPTVPEGASGLDYSGTAKIYDAGTGAEIAEEDITFILGEE